MHITAFCACHEYNDIFHLPAHSIRIVIVFVIR
jgi:hypothetical protein